LLRIAITAAALAAAMPACAHQASSGWTYPVECCSGTDCHEIPSGAVRLNPDGSYTVLATGEVFVSPGRISAGSSARAFRWSQDEHFHRCNRSPNVDASYTYCLFVPQPGS
jgi:hypothetical protein